jgi:hypothetical protein
MYGVFWLLGRIPVLGKLADRRPTADFIAGGIGLAAAVSLWIWMVRRAGVAAAEQPYLIVPALGIGALIGWGLVFGPWRRTTSEIGDILREGPLNYFLWIVGLYGAVGLTLTPLTIDWKQTLASLPDSFSQQILGNDQKTITIPLKAAPDDQTGDLAPLQAVPISYDSAKVSELKLETNASILISDAPVAQQFTMKPVRVEPGETLTWKTGNAKGIPLPADGSRLHIQNRELVNGTVSLTLITRPKSPEAGSILAIAIAVAMMIWSYITVRQTAPRISAVALSTAKNEMSQLLFVVLLAIGLTVIIVSLWIPFYTFGEDIKVVKSTGLTVMMLLSMGQAVWAAGTSIYDEIEGRTALTVLSKPISRRSFWMGKMLGILYVVVLIFVILTLALMTVAVYKNLYDSRESTSDRPTWQQCHLEMITTVQPMCLLLLQAMVIAGIAAAIAPRVPPLANMLICGSIYVIGNLTATIVASGADRFPIVGFIGNLIALLIPNLDSFHIEAAVDAGNAIPLVYLGTATTYAGIFGVLSLMVALLLFEDRDLA